VIGGYGYTDWASEEYTTTETVTEGGDDGSDHVLAQKIGAVAEATFNVALYTFQMQLDEMEARAEAGDEVAKKIDTVAYRAAADEQLAIVKRVLGRR
jgi:hypothetical protein